MIYVLYSMSGHSSYQMNTQGLSTWCVRYGGNLSDVFVFLILKPMASTKSSTESPSPKKKGRKPQPKSSSTLGYKLVCTAMLIVVFTLIMTLIVAICYSLLGSLRNELCATNSKTISAPTTIG